MVNDCSVTQEDTADGDRLFSNSTGYSSSPHLLVSSYSAQFALHYVLHYSSHDPVGYFGAVCVLWTHYCSYG